VSGYHSSEKINIRSRIMGCRWFVVLIVDVNLKNKGNCVCNSSYVA
jgi:hypothetical protein